LLQGCFAHRLKLAKVPESIGLATLAKTLTWQPRLQGRRATPPLLLLLLRRLLLLLLMLLLLLLPPVPPAHAATVARPVSG
jgi:hypothetical protein